MDDDDDDENVPSGGVSSGCAAGGETTGLGKRAVLSHVETSSRDRSGSRVSRGDRAKPANYRVGASINNLQHYIMPRSMKKKTPVKLSESPILSPDTAKALENAEKLIKDAQKQLIEASYDISSSPERDQSIGSDKGNKRDDEDALYIRDIVSTRFHEANESARIFTRPSTRPLAERLCTPKIRKRRATTRHLGEGLNKICSQQLTTRKNVNVREYLRNLKIAENSVKPSGEIKSACKLSNSIGVNNSELNVQEGPRVDIRNELTVTSLENVDIFPEPRSSLVLPVKQNIKTYEFRHKSCFEATDASRNSQTLSEISSSARNLPEVKEKSREPLRKSLGSRPDLVPNKSSRSGIQPELLEGHRPDNAKSTKLSNRAEDTTEKNKENQAESLIDFLKNSDASLTRDNKNSKTLKDRVFGALNTKDKVSIFDRAIDEFFHDFNKHPERQMPDKILSVKCRREEEMMNHHLETCNYTKIDEKSFDDVAAKFVPHNLNVEEIELEIGNFSQLEQTVRKFDETIDKIIAGTTSLGVVMSQYSIEPNNLPESRRNNNNNNEQSATHNPKSSDRKYPDKSVLFNTNKEISAFPRSKVAREAKTMPDTGNKYLTRNSHSRFSTPVTNINNGANEFPRFLIDIQRPLEEKPDAVAENIHDVSGSERRNKQIERHKKIVLDEINGHCNFDSLFNRDRHNKSIDKELDQVKFHETFSFPTYTTEKKEYSSDFANSGIKSIIDDSAIGRAATDQSEKISVGPNLIDERVTRKYSSRSEQSAPVKKKDETSKKENLSTKTLTVKKNSNQVAEIVIIGVENDKTEVDDETKKEFSKEQGEESSDKNRHVASAGSSLKDRTSLDVSTAYSDDFEEPLLSTEKSKSLKKRETSATNVELKSKELSTATVPKINKCNKDDKSLQSCEISSELSKLESEPKRAATEYLEKSVSELSDNNEDPTLNEIKETAKSCSGMKEVDSREVSEKSSKDRASVVSCASLKASSSIVGESHREELKSGDTCSENYSEGELYLPSSCSYSLGEIRISERPSCSNTLRAGIESSSTTNRSNGMNIFFTQSYATFNTTDNTNRQPQSPGEVQETDVESISSSRDLS